MLGGLGYFPVRLEMLREQPVRRGALRRLLDHLVEQAQRLPRLPRAEERLRHAQTVGDRVDATVFLPDLDGLLALQFGEHLLGFVALADADEGLTQIM